MKRRTKNLFIFLIGGILLLAVFGVTMNTNIGGSLWQFDFQIQSLTLDGNLVATEDLPSGGGGGGGGMGGLRDVTYYRNPLNPMDYRSAYAWQIDPDGQPRFDGYSWYGLYPDVKISLSGPWRSDKDGKRLDYNAPSTIDREWVIGGITYRKYLYYYTIDVLTEVKQDTFLVPGLISWQSAECGVMEIESKIAVFMKRSIFQDVLGEFMSAKVLAVEVPETFDGSLVYRVAPKISIGQHPGTPIGVLDTIQGDDYYGCNLRLFCTITPGLVQSGISLMPYDDVYVKKTIIMEMMLEEHLQIGELGEEIDPVDPIKFVGQFDIAGYILLILVLIVIVVIAIAVIRVAPIFAGRRH